MKNIQSLTKTHPGISGNWTLYGKSLKHLKEKDINAGGFKVTEIKNYLSEDTVINAEDTQHVLILDRIVHKKKDPVNFLSTICRMLVRNGFALLSEFTSNFETAKIVDIFENVISGKTDFDNDDGTYTYYTHEEWLKIFDKAGLYTVAYRSHNLMTTAYVLRKKPANPVDPVFFTREEYAGFSWLEPLKQKLEETINAPPENTIIMFSDQTNEFGFMGFLQCVKYEYGKKNRLRLMAIQNDESNSIQTKISGMNDPLLTEQIQYDLIMNFFRNGQWGSMRRMHFTEDELAPYRETTHANLQIVQSGNLNSLTWVNLNGDEFEVNSKRSEDLLYVSVYYSPLNFRDIMLASGKLNSSVFTSDNTSELGLLGIEFAGRCKKTGTRYMGMLPFGLGFSQNILVHKDYCTEIPDHWSLQDAATVPIAYMTVFYALVIRANIQKGESILIHSAAGGVGLAAIYACQHFECQIFVTCGTEAKKKFLLEKFPKLKEDCIFTSRSADFQLQVMNKTNGKGVDLVLNSLSESLLQASIQCLAQNGRFTEIGKYDMMVNNKLSTDLKYKNASFHGIVLDALWHNSGMFLETKRVFNDALAQGIVQPLPVTVFEACDVIEAYRYMAQGKHTGKVIVEIKKEERELKIMPKATIMKALKKNHFHPEHVYILAGGLGGFGLELANWLIRRGATKIVLTSRSGAKTGYQKRCIYFWRKFGTTVKVSTLNIVDLKQTYQLIKESQEMGPIGGVFNLSMVLRDTLFENQSVTNYEESCAPKVTGTENLDIVTRELCDDKLKWFIFFSSIASSKGNPGQSAYGYANSAGEYVCTARRRCGLPGINVQFGGIADVGVLVNSIEDNKRNVSGNALQRVASVLNSFDLLLTLNKLSVASFVCADVGAQVVLDHEGAVEAVAKILGIQDIKQVDQDELLSNMGIDSLMAVQIKQLFEQSYDVYLSTNDLKSLTLNKLRAITKQAQSAQKKTAESKTSKE